MTRLTVLILLVLSSAAHAVEVCWTNPTTLDNGQPITNLREVMLFWSKVAKPVACAKLADCPTWPIGNKLTLTSVPGAKVCTDMSPAPGTYYVAATARLGNEEVSDFSNVPQKVVPEPRPNPPVLALDPTCPTGVDCVKVLGNSVVVLGPGAPVVLRWKPVEAASIETEVRVYRTDARVAARVLGPGARWKWTPSSPGLYYATARICSAGTCSGWVSRENNAWLYHAD